MKYLSKSLRHFFIGIFAFLFTIYPSITCSKKHKNEWIILLHGLARSKSSMQTLEKNLIQSGYSVLNLDYPSRKQTIQNLVEKHLIKAIETCQKQEAKTIHFVTHSMGGILVRYYLKNFQLPELGHVVMLSPPNAGSEVVDALKNLFLFKWLNGPAGQQLGTDDKSIPIELGEADFILGIITGDRSINWILSCIIPGPDDGKVSVERAKLKGMNDFRVIHATHPFIMQNSEAIELTIKFIKTGSFD